MPSSSTCPACRATLHVGDHPAGQPTRCPRCGAAVPDPAAPIEVLPAEAVLAPGRSSVPTKPCPACGEPVAYTARKCRHCRTWIEDDEEEGSFAGYRPCPRCGSGDAKRVIFTFWGSFYGPALFTHVRCPRCGYAYNGRTGRSNLVPAVVFVTVPLLLIVGILGGLAFVLYMALH